MSARLPPLGAFRAFEAAVRHLSFKKAAEELHVTPAAISHQIKALEDHLGVQLFERLPRAIALTDPARAMLPKVREAFECLAVAIERGQMRPDTGKLSISAPPSFASHWLMPRLHRFAALHPEVDLSLSSRSNLIDKSGGEGLELGEGDAEVFIRYGGNQQYQGCRVKALFTPTYLPACRPDFLEGENALLQPSDLRHYTLIHDDTIPDEADRPSWDAWLRAAGVTDVDASRGPHFSDGGLALEAAIDGLGIVLALKPLVEADVVAGRLVFPFDMAMPTHAAYYLAVPEAVAERRAVVDFCNWLIEEARVVEVGMQRELADA